MLWAPHPGQAGFEALGEVLTGKTDSAGRSDAGMEAMIAADAVLGVLLAVLEIIAIKRFIDRRKKAIAE